jgi:hypothetical protein
MQDQIETIGMLIVKGVVLPLVGLFVAWASAKLPALISARVKNESVAGVLDRLTQLAFTVVTEVQQTVVSGLGDKANAEALRGARDQAITTLKGHLGPQGIKELTTVLGIKTSDAVDKLIVTYIESAVHNLKTSQPLTTATATVTPEGDAKATVTTEEPKS